MALTLSFHQMANVAHREHNNRNPNAVRNMDHIDSSLDGGNLILKDMRLRDAYEAAYGDSTRRFRVKQIEKKVRKSRLATDYYNSVKKDTRRNLCYEIVLQIGDWDTIGIRTWYTEEEKKYLRSKKEVTDNWDYDTDGWKGENATLEREIHKVNNARIARETMMEYAEKWEENNPNMFLFGAYLHADEKDGTLHMHLDYLPMAKGYELGQDIQNGLERACRQNVEARLTKAEINARITEHSQKTGKRMSFLHLWQDLQREDIVSIAKEKGLDLSWDRDSLKHQRHLNTPEYKAKMEAFHELDRKLQNQQEKIEKNHLLIADIMEEIHEKQEMVASAEGNVDRIQKEMIRLESEKEKLQKQSEMIKEECSSLTKDIEHLKEEHLTQEKIIKDTKNRIDTLSDEIIPFEEAEKKVKQYIELPKKAMFGNKIKLEAEEYADLMDTLKSAITYSLQLKEETAEAQRIATAAVKEKTKAIFQRDRMVLFRDDTIKAAVDPLEKEVEELKHKVSEATADLRETRSKLYSYEWLDQLNEEEMMEIQKVKAKHDHRMELRDKLGEIDRKLILARQGDKRYNIDELYQEGYKIMIENDLPVPKKLLEHIERIEKEKEAALGEEMEWDER